MAAQAWSPLRCYWLEAKHELLRLMRTPSFVLPTLLFPAVFYLLFAVLLAGSSGKGAAHYLLAGYGVFGIMGAALFGFGVTVASERERGLLRLKRALPMPQGAYLLAKMVAAMVFAVLISLILAALAVAFADIALSPRQWTLLLLVNVAGVLPFCALGLYIGSRVNASAAPAVVNLLYLPMGFLSGLWLPLQLLPDAIGWLAPVWPSYHLGELAQKVVGGGAGSPAWMHLGVLMVFTGVFFVLARARLARCD